MSYSMAVLKVEYIEVPNQTQHTWIPWRDGFAGPKLERRYSGLLGKLQLVIQSSKAQKPLLRIDFFFGICIFTLFSI